MPDQFFELLNDGNDTYAVGPFMTPEEGASWAQDVEKNTPDVTSHGGVRRLSVTAWNLHLTQQGQRLLHTVQVNRPGLPSIYLGFSSARQAESAGHSIKDALRNPAHVDGTRVVWGRTPAGITSRAPLPTDPYEIAMLMEKEDRDLPTGHAFPDTFMRLMAQEGYEETTRIWRAACQWLMADTENDGTES